MTAGSARTRRDGRPALSIPSKLALVVVSIVTITPTVWAQEGAQQQDTTRAQARDTVPARAGLAGPNQVDNQLAEDRDPKKPLIELTFLQPYLDFKDRLEASSGFSFGLDYTAVYFNGTESVGERAAGSGMVRLFGRWELVGRSSNNRGALVFKVEHRHGYSTVPPSGLSFELGYVGLIAAPFSDAGFLLGNLYWQQKLADGRVVLVGGWVDATDYVDVYGLASPWLHFSNLAFSIGSASIPVPDQGLGLAAGVWASNHVYVLGGLADSNSDPTRPGDGFESFFDVNEYFTHIEVGWTTARDRVYFDNIHLTFWHADERVAAATPNGWGLNLSGTWYVADKWLPFLRAGYAEDGGSLLQKSVSTGVGYQWIPGRDLIGFGFNWGQPNASTFSAGLPNQYSFELFYRLQLAGELAITPDLQLLINPALNPSSTSTWVFGVRGRLAL